jgi:hypothetical protein
MGYEYMPSTKTPYFKGIIAAFLRFFLGESPLVSMNRDDCLCTLAIRPVAGDVSGHEGIEAVKLWS